MIKQSLSDRYKVDPYGTEEIISSAANSCAPILTIDYGDEVQTDAEFTIRPTKGSLDTNISDVASINPIKGNTIAWNQLIENGNFIEIGSWTTDNGQLVVEGNVATVTVISNEDTTLHPGKIQTYANHKYFVCVDVLTNGKYLLLSTAFSGSEPTTNSTSWSKLKLISSRSSDFYGKYPRLLYQNAMQGDYFKAKNFVMFDLTIIYGTGNEPSTVEAFEADYYKWFGKQLTYEPYSAGELRPVKMNGIKTTGANNSWVNVNPIPVTTLTGKLNGQGSSVIVFPDGLKRAGSVYDEIKKEGGVTKAVKRVGSVDLGSLNWEKYSDEGLSLFHAQDSDIKYYNTYFIHGACSKYLMTGYLYSQLPDKCISLNNGAFSTGSHVYIKDDSYSDAATFKTAMSGVMLYYELATHEEYILDALDILKIMLGANEVLKVYLGNDVIFQS